MQPIQISILYHDDHLLVVEKPTGIPTLGDHTGDEDLLSLLRRDPRLRTARALEPEVYPVHRLDRPAGGVMLFARSRRAASFLGQAIRRRQVQKSYLAVVEGRPEPAAGRLEDYLIKDERRNQVRVGAKGDEGAMRAILEYRVRETRHGRSLLQIELETGRPHQIRAQLSAMGHPLIGDVQYGAKAAGGKDRIALWSFILIVAHPLTRRKLKWYSSPPAAAPWSDYPSLQRRPEAAPPPSAPPPRRAPGKRRS